MGLSSKAAVSNRSILDRSCPGSPPDVSGNTASNLPSPWAAGQVSYTTVVLSLPLQTSQFGLP